MLAAASFSQVAEGAITAGWHVIILDENRDDLFLRATQDVVGAGPALVPVIEYSTDPAFLTNVDSIIHDPEIYQNLFVTAGVPNRDNGASGGSRPSLTLNNAQFAPAGLPRNTNPGVRSVVPGTLTGSLAIDDRVGTDTVEFTTQSLNDGLINQLVFRSDSVAAWTTSITVTHTYNDPADTDPSDGINAIDAALTITGILDVANDTIAFRIQEDGLPFSPRFGPADIVATYASPIVPRDASVVRVAPGRDLNTGLLIDLPGDDSSIQISSPVVNSGTANRVVLAATNVEIDAPITSSESFYALGTTGGVGSWFGGGSEATTVERLVIAAPVAAPQIGLHVVEDTATAARSRGIIHVSASGTLSAASAVVIEAARADVILEGAVSGKDHSYVFNTANAATPYRFVTVQTGNPTGGAIIGDSIDVILSNEDPLTPGDVVEHIIDLDTDVSSLRIAAAQSAGQVSAMPPFRYAVTIREADDLSLDASLASAGPVAITAGGGITVNASVQSTGDVTLAGSGAITGNAWLTTVDGQISITGSAVSLVGLMQVLAPPVDETLTDIEVVATNGGIFLGGGALAVNRVRLDQSGTGAVLSSGAVAAEHLQVFAEGAVNLRTQSRYIAVESGGEVFLAEADNAEFDVTAAGLTSLIALGVDPNDGSGRAALKAEMRGASKVVVSAPSGSIDVTSMTAGETTIGDAVGLLAGAAASMRAAGDVSIRSTQGDIIVLDAPLAGDGVLRARVASGAGVNLTGVYSQNSPGITPATLTGGGNRNLNGESNFAAIFPGLGGGSLRVRDLVLLRGQTDAEENGLYQIIQLGSNSTPWRLTRVSQADTTAEFGTNTRIAITDGQFAGQSFRVGDYANVLNSTPLAVRQGSTRSSSEVTVRLATAAVPLAATFAAGVIRATANGQFSAQGVVLAVGDLVLVTHGVTPAPGESSVANGVYQVTDAGAIGSPWELTRLSGVAETSVIVSEGFYRTALSGKTFTVAYDGLGVANVSIDPVALAVEIGSFDPRDMTTFVVSTAGGTNDDAGSLGKMLRLVQDNSAQDLSQEGVLQTVRFGNVLGSVTGATGTIVLRQELPVVGKAFEIDTATRYPLAGATTRPIVIDGSRITSTRENTFVTQGTEVNGFEFVAGATTVLTPTPEEANRSRMSGLRIAGFEAGAAVVVDGASNLLLDNLTIGVNAAGESQAVKYGIRVTGNSGVTGPVTLLNNSIFSASVFDSGTGGAPLAGTGVLIDGNAQAVQVVGGTVGGSDGSNTTGIVIESMNDDTSRANSIGANPLPRVQLDTTANRSTLTIPAELWSTIGEDLYLGQSVTGVGIAPDSSIIHINPATRAVVLNSRMTSSIVGTTIIFGTTPRTVVSENFYGVEMRSGHVRMTNTTVADNVLDGVVVGITPRPAASPAVAQQALWARIGAGILLDSNGVNPAIRSAASNEIISNGRYGIRFAGGITGLTPAGGQISVQGNFVGTNVAGAPGLFNGRSSYGWDATAIGFSGLTTVSPDTTDDPRTDNFGRNINAELSPATVGLASDPLAPSGSFVGGSGSSSGVGSGISGVSNDGVVRLPPRL